MSVVGSATDLTQQVGAAIDTAGLNGPTSASEGWVSFPIAAELVDDIMRLLHGMLDLGATEKAGE